MVVCIFSGCFGLQRFGHLQVRYRKTYLLIEFNKKSFKNKKITERCQNELGWEGEKEREMWGKHRFYKAGRNKTKNRKKAHYCFHNK